MPCGLLINGRYGIELWWSFDILNILLKSVEKQLRECHNNGELTVINIL